MSNTKGDPSLSMATAVYLFFFVLIFSVTADNLYVPSDNILLNCGSPSNTSSLDGRMWTSDMGSKLAPSAQYNTSTASEASAQGSSVPQLPYMTARVFHSQLTYSLPVSAGPKFIRLYFYPASYSGLNKSNAYFSVFVSHLTLLRNFSASLSAEYLNQDYITREFCINVEGQRLNITFTPTPNTYGFVNGIEVVSMPANLYFLSEEIFLVGQRNMFSIDNTTALETVYRLNIGGKDISPEEDTGMFRSWFDDSRYIFGAAFGVTVSNWSTQLHINYPPTVPPYTAPESVYRTARSMGSYANINANYNLTWLFNIDSGFYYLFRLYFCEIQFEVTEKYQRMFSIFIGNTTAEEEADVFYWSGGNGIPVYKDYVVMVPDSGGKQDLWLALHPKVAFYCDVILNGLEIFKLSKPDGSLAGPNYLPTRPVFVAEPAVLYPRRRSKMKNHTWIILAISVVGGVTSIVALSLLYIFVSRHQRQKDDVPGDIASSMGSTKLRASSLPSELCRHFSFAEIIVATNNFDDTLRIGVGGFGSVYKGYIDSGASTVAIKRGDPTAQQGALEFKTEIEMLSMLRHLHLVSLIGYCTEDQEMILVYDYMTYGTLRDHLYGKNKPPLSWKKRLQICIGAARGLHYLHFGMEHPIIHRDVKTTNILLDEKWVAKISDFGLSKVGPTSVSHTHVSTMVKGTFGYLDPEYYRYQQLTEKSDVYSFGVVLLEVFSGRPAVNLKLDDEQASLAEWGRECCRKGTLGQIVDPYLRDKIARECLEKFAEIAENCLAEQGIKRPTMSDVLWNLEFALQLQETAEEDRKGGGPLSCCSFNSRKHMADNENNDVASRPFLNG